MVVKNYQEQQQKEEQKQQHAETDWDYYYRKPYKFNIFLKRVITRLLVKYIKRHAAEPGGFTILEFGGGNSCFYETFDRVFSPQFYYIVDKNQVGLDTFKEKTGDRGNVVLLNRDILASQDQDQYQGKDQEHEQNQYQHQDQTRIEGDVVFSIGLIEHFSREDTRQAILAHLDALKKNGLLILGFPTPTFLYRFMRKVSEMLGTWIFYDERPIKIKEVLEIVSKYGIVLETKIVWSIIFTQAIIVARKSL